MLVERSSFSYAEITKMVLCDSMFKVLSLTVVLLCCETPPKITSCGVMFLDQDSCSLQSPVEIGLVSGLN